MDKDGRHASTASVFGHEAMTSHGIAWGAGARRWPRPKSYLGRIASVFGWTLCGVAALAIYTNVMADDSVVRVRADMLARQHAGCGDQCHVARMQGRRSVLEYRADYDIDGIGSVEVVCRRSAIVVGEHQCITQ
jgi:hypothetical protein